MSYTAKERKKLRSLAAKSAARTRRVNKIVKEAQAVLEGVQPWDRAERLTSETGWTRRYSDGVIDILQRHGLLPSFNPPQTTLVGEFIRMGFPDA